MGHPFYNFPDCFYKYIQTLTKKTTLEIENRRSQEVWSLNDSPKAKGANISVRRFDGTVLALGDSISVPAHGISIYRVNDVESADKYGQLNIQIDSPHSLVGWVLRRRPDFVMVTPVDAR